MEQTQLIMGMPIKITAAADASRKIVENTFEYFRAVDARYSSYKPTSEISRINQGLPEARWSAEMREVLRLCALTAIQTHGYFNINQPDGALDPSGLVKGWAIRNAASLLEQNGVNDFSIDAGGDLQVRGSSPSGDEWRIGIRNPFDRKQIVKVVGLRDQGIATSGTSIRGQHIYNPHTGRAPDGIVSLSVIGPDVYDADRFATAAFAMGQKGISFIENLEGFEGYMIDANGTATMTSGFAEYTR